MVHVADWLSRDPLGEYAGINLYGYVLDDPVNGIDPFGLCGNGSGGGGFSPFMSAAITTVAVGGGPEDPVADIAAGGIIIGGGIYLVYEHFHQPTMPTIWDARQSGKERADDIPSWAQGQKPLPGESGKDYADRLLKDKYGPGNYPTGPGSEQNKLKKYGDRGCK